MSDIETLRLRAAYLRGYENAIDEARKSVTESCQKRSDEIPSVDRRIDIAFTRDRILGTLSDMAEKAAVKRVSVERQIDPHDDAGPGDEVAAVTLALRGRGSR